ncbi:MAG TPA: cation diffusion facilitator family transporter [Phenylobacterium sp.]|nr:cation diffusion facilitator family transporter [Phenylobacterium sp.]
MSAGHHHHDHAEGMSDARLIGAVAVNVLLTVAQIVGGIVSGSLSLIADALHNLNDAASLALALVARKIGRRPADKLMTFGYGQAEVVAALINLTTLIIVGLYLVYEAIVRFFDPQPIEGWIIVIVAGVALVIDVATALMVRVGAKHSINIKTAFLHNVSDALASVGVIVAGTLILMFDLYIADLVVTLIIAAYVLYQGFSLLPRTVRLLMGATPDDLDFDGVVAAIRGVEGVRDVYHVHIWHLGEHARALEAHVEPHGASIAEFADAKARIRAMLARDFRVKHATLEACAPGEHPRAEPLQTPHDA